MIGAESLWELVVRRAEATPGNIFAIDEDQRSLSFAQYRDASERCAAGLAENGVTAETRVSWQLPTTIDALILCAALSRLGAVQNPILPIYREKEVGFVVEQLGSEVLIVDGVLRGFDHAAMAESLARRLAPLRALDLSSGLPDGNPADLSAFAEGDADPVRWVLYSSGTTADPKGAKHTDGTLLAASDGFARRLLLRADDQIALVFPVTHVGGILWLMNGLRVGCRQIVIAQFDPAITIPFLAQHGVTQATAGTVFHQAYLSAQRENPSSPLFPNLRTLPGGGAPKPPQLFFDIRRELNAPIVSGYGLTECPVLAMNGPDDPDLKLAHTEGRACPEIAEIRICDLEGRVLAADAEGEIRVRAPQLCRGYWNASLDDDAFDADGFFRTGDLGALDEAGFLRVTGRLKDVIIRKGENISAKEIEDQLFRHDAVAEVAVIGLPDVDRGELCCAVVVLVSGQPALGFDEMVRFLGDAGLMRHKIPERLEHVGELPRNPTGKVLKEALKQRFSNPS